MRHEIKGRRDGFSLVELLVVIAIIGVLIALLLPALRTTGHRGARRAHCLNNLRQIALATLNYESAHMKFPAATGLRAAHGAGASDQYGCSVAILPFIEQNEIYDAITKGDRFDGVQLKPYPRLYSAQVPYWETDVPGYQCLAAETPREGPGPIHYGFCIGDRARNIAAPESSRGIFVSPEPITFGHFGDGSSNTILVAEIIGASTIKGRLPFAIDQEDALLENPAKCWKLIEGNEQDWNYRSDVPLNPIGRGGHWADGRAGIAFFNTILPPNSPSAAVGGSEGVDGIYSAGGPHPGGVNTALGDGSTHFVSNDIDAGDSSHPAPTAEEMASGTSSPYGPWGAAGTINGGEVVDVTEF